jgi:hypothetical protein
MSRALVKARQQKLVDQLRLKVNRGNSMNTSSMATIAHGIALWYAAARGQDVNAE